MATVAMAIALRPAMAINGFGHSTFNPTYMYVQLVDVYSSKTMLYVGILDSLFRKPL